MILNFLHYQFQSNLIEAKIKKKIKKRIIFEKIIIFTLKYSNNISEADTTIFVNFSTTVFKSPSSSQYKFNEAVSFKKYIMKKLQS